MDCLFCKILREEIPCHKVYEDDKTFAFLDINPKTRGHVLVIPKTHSAGIYDVLPEDMHACANTAKKLASSMIASLGTTGVNVFQNTGVDAQQTVPHYHVHVMPRYADDQQLLFATSEENSPLKDIADIICTGL